MSTRVLFGDSAEIASYLHGHNVGSVGTRAYLALLFGNGDDDPLFLQIKEATTPAHAPYLPAPPLRSPHDGFRVVGAQRILQSLGDPMLGYTTIDGRPYYVRQMKNMKASMPVSLMDHAFADFAESHGDQTERDHAELVKAIKRGRVKAAEE